MRDHSPTGEDSETSASDAPMPDVDLGPNHVRDQNETKYIWGYRKRGRGWQLILRTETLNGYYYYEAVAALSFPHNVLENYTGMRGHRRVVNSTTPPGTLEISGIIPTRRRPCNRSYKMDVEQLVLTTNGDTYTKSTLRAGFPDIEDRIAEFRSRAGLTMPRTNPEGSRGPSNRRLLETAIDEELKRVIRANPERIVRLMRELYRRQN